MSSFNQWLSILSGNTSNSYYSGNSIGNTFNLLPMAMKVAARTIGLDLVAVKPCSSPSISIGFIDFKYDTPETRRKQKQKIRQEKLKNLNKLFRKDKIKYIDELLKNN